MKVIKYEFSWCEYLTPCKYKYNINVGEYECSKCEFFIGFLNNKKSNYGYLICSHK